MEFLGPVKAAFADASNLKIEYGQADLELWGIKGVQLRSYQLDGFRWIAERHKIGHGCILGDEMGLGKTLQVHLGGSTTHTHTCACTHTVDLLPDLPLCPQ